MKQFDITNELDRTYKIFIAGWTHIIVIKNPKQLFYEPGHTFHRIFDGLRTYLAPTPGILLDRGGLPIGYVELSWEPRDLDEPCQF